MQITLRKRFEKGFFTGLSYTLGKSIDDQSVDPVGASSGGGLSTTNSRTPTDIRDWRGERSRSDFDRRHVLTVNSIWDLPFGKGQKFGSSMNKILDGVIGGWETNAIALVHTGFPLGFSTASNQSGTGVGNRPNMTCNGRLSSDSQTVNKWFDTSCFVSPTPGTIGNAPRSPEVYGPNQVNFDMSLYKNFPITETSRIQFRSEFFNLFNHAQFATPNTVVGNSAFGRILSTAHSSRQIQFALKVVF